MIVAACHDAGGAEVVSAWLRKEGVEFSAILGGPAKAVFRRKFGEVRTAPGLRRAGLVLCGTGNGPLERIVWRLAKADGVRTVAYVDHWKNYADRFWDEDVFSFPDEIWVTDERAKEIAQRELPGAGFIAVKGNPYVEEVVAEVAEIGQESHWGTRVLYVAEPGRPMLKISDLRRVATEEFESRYRSHPADERPELRPLVEDLAWADVVVGYDSMALYVATRAKRRAVSFLPPDEKMSLPDVVERLYPYDFLPR